MIRKCNIRNYSIYLKDDVLFGYFEYHGTDYSGDMAKMAADPKTQESVGDYDADADTAGRVPGRVVGHMEECFIATDLTDIIRPRLPVRLVALCRSSIHTSTSGTLDLFRYSCYFVPH